MVRWLSLFVITAFPCLCFCQLGINSRYLIGQSRILDTVGMSQNGVHTSIEYHMRLKQKRLEFRPGLGYRFTFNSPDLNGNLTSYDFDFGTAIYPFDFAGDCNCPTFSKQGTLVKKGFFFELIPGAAYQILKRVRSEPNDPSKLPIRSKNLVWKLGGAAGLDIGLSERYTVTPMLSATYLSSSEWEGLNADGSSGKLDDFVYLGAGLRLSYNADDNRRRRN
ncbi:MAG: hypothetical protein M3R25_12880 [Bacteroidota bacterium]|nr:hypothetical protein [Bacteroidota bacterium]